MNLFGQEEWWKSDKFAVGTRLIETVSQIESGCGDRRFANVVYNRLATGRDLPNVYGLAMQQRSYVPFAGALATYQPPSVNVCAMAVEALTSKVGRNKPWLMFSTTEAGWKMRRRAKMLSRYIDGVFWSAQFWNILPDVFRDMLTFADGVGVVKWFWQDGKIQCERTIPEEILVDPADAIHGRPRSLYQRTFAAKARLAALNPAHADAIKAASGAHPGLGWYQGTNMPEQFAPVVEGWHLAEGDEPGRHVYCVGDTVIRDEKWEGGYPFSFLRGYPLGHGFFRQGIVEQLVPYQAKLDRIERVIDEAQWRMGTPKWFAPAGSKVDAAKLVAKVAAVVNFHGATPPIRDTGPAVSPELYSERREWIRLALDRVGLSMDAVTGQKPDGLNSGEAQRVHSQIASIRLATLALALENCVVDSGVCVLDLAKKHKPAVKSPGRRRAKLIDWDAAKPDPDGFTMKAFPISSLPQEPAGLIARANELLQMGQIDGDQYARLLNNPDVQQATDPVEAARDDVESMLDDIVDDGLYRSPDQYMPFDLALKLAVSRYRRERSLGAPDDVLEDLSRWIEEVRELMAPPPEAAAAPVPAPAAGADAGAITQIAPADVLPAPALVPELLPAAA